jgi:hypothetical protein
MNNIYKNYYRILPSIEDCNFNLDKIIDNNVSYNIFRDYLIEECISEETLLFCRDVDNINIMNSVENQYILCKKIIEKYINIKSDYELNICMIDRYITIELFNILEKYYLNDKKYNLNNNSFELLKKNLIGELEYRKNSVVKNNDYDKENNINDMNNITNNDYNKYNKDNNNMNDIIHNINNIIHNMNENMDNNQNDFIINKNDISYKLLIYEILQYEKMNNREEYKKIYKDESILNIINILLSRSENEQLNFKNIFSYIYNIIYDQLHNELFPRFINSNKFKKMLLNKNIILNIASIKKDNILNITNIYVYNRNKILLKLSTNDKIIKLDNNNNKLRQSKINIHEIDFKFLKSIYNDIDLWKNIFKYKKKYNNYCDIYESKNKLCFDYNNSISNKKYKLYKTTGILPYSLENTINVMLSSKNIKQYNPTMIDISNIDIIQPKNHFNYSTSITSELHNFSILHKKRYYIMMSSLKKDKYNDQYMLFQKSLSRDILKNNKNKLSNIDMSIIENKYNFNTVYGYKINAWILKNIDIKGKKCTLYYNILQTDLSNKIYNYNKKLIMIHHNLNKLIKSNMQDRDIIDIPNLSFGLFDTLNEN